MHQLGSASGSDPPESLSPHQHGSGGSYALQASPGSLRVSAIRCVSRGHRRIQPARLLPSSNPFRQEPLTSMGGNTFVLPGRKIRLEPLETHHVDALAAASAVDPTLYQWSPVPQGKSETPDYVNTALAARDAGTAVPFAIVRLDGGVVIGSTRFFDLERWAWPSGHALHGRSTPDACEIGYTWFTQSAVRTGANTEAKFLMLTHAFEQWQARRGCVSPSSA